MKDGNQQANGMASGVTRPQTKPQRAIAPAPAPSAGGLWVAAAALILVTLALYWPATGHDFVHYDDHLYVVDNPHVNSGLSWANARWAFQNTDAFNWHPLTWLSHMLDCQLFGLRPWGHHFTNVVLHALNVLLVFMWLKQMTGARWRSLAVAALFAVHPLRVESVAWVAERKDVLSGCFGLLALMAYTRYGQIQSLRFQGPLSEPGGAPAPAGGLPAWAFYLLALVCLALGLMSKPMLVTWPFVFLLLDYWPLQRWEAGRTNAEGRSQKADARRPGAASRGQTEDRATQPPSSFVLRPFSFLLLLEKLPFFALAAAASLVTFVAQQHGGAVVTMHSLPFWARLGNALVSYCRYVGKLLWPSDLAVFYPHHVQWPLAAVLLAGALLLGLSALGLRRRQRSPYFIVGWLWFLGTLVPVIGLVQVGDQAMADRYSYLPCLGLLIPLVWGGNELSQRWRWARAASAGTLGLALLLCLGLTHRQLGDWKDSEALFRHVVEVTRNNSLAHCNLGIALLNENRFEEAVSEFEAALRLNPEYSQAHYYLGCARDKQGRLDAAIAQFEAALQFKADYADAHNKLGYALMRKGRVDEAIGQYQAALRLKPEHADAHCNLGVALMRKGRMEEAISHYQEAVRLKPEDAGAYYNLGNALAARNQLDEALNQYQQALRRKPDYPEACNNLGIVLIRKGDLGAAIHQFQAALRLKPDYAQARENLARAMEMTPSPAGH